MSSVAQCVRQAVSAALRVQRSRCAMASAMQRVRQALGIASKLHPVPSTNPSLRLTLHSSRPPTAAAEFDR